MRKRLLAVIAVALPLVTAWPVAALGIRSPVQLPDSATPARGAIKTPSIVGSLYDSLSVAPLAGAVVHLRGTLITATSDSLGRFRLDLAPAGPQVIWIEHARLDAMGLYTVAAAVHVSADSTATVALGVPSFATLWRRACGDVPAPVADTGFVFGHLVRMTGSRADSEAFVQASWRGRAPSAGDSAGTLPTISRARVAGDGTFALCGVPSSERVSLRASDGAFATPPITLRAGALRIARRDLTLADPDALAASEKREPTMEQPAPDQGATIHGAVTDANGAAIVGARILVGGVSGEARTNASGQYTVAHLPAGARRVTVEVLGYLPAYTIADLYADDSVRVDAALSKVTTLRAVTVSERMMYDARIKDFAHRQHIGIAHFIDSTTVERAVLMQNAIQVPAVTIRTVKGGWRAIAQYHGRDCMMPMYVDGRSAGGQDIDRLKAQNEIASIEVYARGDFVPPEISPYRQRGACGAIFVWTKGFFNP